MNSNIWMPLYVADYLADTQRLSTEQHGAYLLLIMAYWHQGGPLKDDDEDLAQITKLGPKWKTVRPRLAPFFTVENGVWRHKRIEAEMIVTDQKRVAKQAKIDAMNAARHASTRASTTPPTRVSTRVSTTPPTRALQSQSQSHNNNDGDRARDPAGGLPSQPDGEKRISGGVPPLTVEAAKAEAQRLGIPEVDALNWFNSRAHPDHEHSLTRKLDWTADMAIWWNKCGAGKQKKEGDVAETSGPPNGTSGKPMSPAMQRMSVEGALKRLAEQIANHPGTFAIASEADKGRLRDLHRLRKKLQAELTELDAELVT